MRSKIFARINAQTLLRQVNNMPHRGQDRKIPPKKLLDRLSFRRRLYNYKFFRHRTVTRPFSFLYETRKVTNVCLKIRIAHVDKELFYLLRVQTCTIIILYNI